MTEEWITEDGLNQNAELIKDYYTHMVFGTGNPTAGDTSPANEVLRKAVTSAVRTANGIEWTAGVELGDFAEDTYITDVWMMKPGTPDIFLACHPVNAQLVNGAHGFNYVFSYAVNEAEEAEE